VFAQVRPQHSSYQKLREVLKHSTVLSPVDWGEIPVAGKSIRVGMHDARVPQLQERLALAG